MLTKEQRDEILRLVLECVAVGNEGGGKQAMALCDYLDSITVPEGWQMVPVEPTQKMLDSARDWSIRINGIGIGNEQASGCYSALLAAAPKPGDSNE